MSYLSSLKIKYLRRYRRLFSTITLPDIDLDYYCNNSRCVEIENNINIRKGTGDIKRVMEIYSNYRTMANNDPSYNTTREYFYKELMKLPNKTHPAVKNYGEEPCLIKTINNKRVFGDHKPLEFSEITRVLNLLRTDKLGHTCGPKSYYFLGELAELEEALIKYTVTALLNENFQLISVPDILPSNVIESCGMSINSERTQIYCLDPVHHGPDLNLSGTAEMSLAGLLAESIHKGPLPLKLAAVSRCFRAETSNLLEEKGIYRVHQFTKVEMFAVTRPQDSDEMLEYIRGVQESLFAPLGIHMKVLDMPPHELGAPAYRKYDIEAWMPGRQNYGEISSCSNCTDYQSRRLHMKYIDDESNEHYVHTLNGTACAIPRMLIALLETHQHPKGKIEIPKVLQSFMGGKEFIGKNTSVPELKLMKLKK